MDVVAILDTWRQVLTVDFLRYFLTAAPFYLVFWVWRPAWIRGRRIQSSDPERVQVLSEIAYRFGYASLGPFNRAFKEIVGQTPTEYRKAATEREILADSEIGEASSKHG